jgi:hypothetical protein
MPEAMVSVNIRSILPYSAGTPAATLPWIHTSQSMSLCFAGCQSLGGYRGDQRVWG